MHPAARLHPDRSVAAARRSLAAGLPVGVTTFEAREPAGRIFDAVIATQSWHWVNPVAGAAKAAEVLRPRRRLAISGHVFEPPAEVAEPFATAFQKVAPDSPFNNQPARRLLQSYPVGYDKTADTLRHTQLFDEPEQWQFGWSQSYTRNEWLDLLPTTGGLTRLLPDQLAEILDAVGAAIDKLGGRFTMEYTTLAVTASRTERD